jgi:N-acetylneuraminic acid mutarotase
MPAPRAAHAVAVTSDGLIHVVGGVDGLGQGLPAEPFVFDPADQSWATLPPMPTPREHLGAAYHDGVVYVAAGRAGGVSDMQTFEAYDVATQEWTSLPDVPTGRSGIATVAFDGQIYVFGGETFGTGSRTYDEAERYDPAADAWEELAPMPTARHGLGAAVLDGRVHVVSGGPEAGFSFSGVHEVLVPEE